VGDLGDAARLKPRGWLALAGLALACGAGAVWAVGSKLAAPVPRAIGPPPPELSAESVEFASGSGSFLRGWLVRGAPGRGVVVLAHAVRGSRLDMLPRAAFLTRAGHSVLLFDQQAHGESPGRFISFGWLEAHDAAAAVGFAAERLPGESIGYLGVSQGGAAALLSPAPLPVSALVLEAVYPTLAEAVAARLRIRLGALGPPLAPLLLLQLRPRLGVSADVLRPIEGIRAVRAPILLIAGGRDAHTPLAESERLFGAAPGPKELWVLPEAAHRDFHRVAGAVYEERILDFFAAHLGRG
jgi:fermentation-respiration switch protein FrsA (DUF1100 family)